MTDDPHLDSAQQKALDDLIDGVVQSQGAALSLFQERLPAPLPQLLAETPPEPIPGRFLSASPLDTLATDRVYKAWLKDGKAILVHLIFAQDITVTPALEQAVERWKEAITESWLSKQSEQEQANILGIQPLIVRLGGE